MVIVIGLCETDGLGALLSTNRLGFPKYFWYDFPTGW
jgi:hypothetical protein